MKKIIDRYQYYYIGLCLFVYLLSWFISWDARFNNLILYPFVTQICLPVIGAITLVLALVVKKVSFFFNRNITVFCLLDKYDYSFRRIANFWELANIGQVTFQRNKSSSRCKMRGNNL